MGQSTLSSSPWTNSKPSFFRHLDSYPNVETSEGYRVLALAVSVLLGAINTEQQPLDEQQAIIFPAT